MQNKVLNISKFEDNMGFKYNFYTQDKTIVRKNFIQEVDLNQKVQMIDDRIYFNDTSVSGHLKIYYIVIEESKLNEEIYELGNTILLMFMIVYAFLSIVGYFLAKFLISPIQQQRKKLNDFIKDTTHEINTPLSALLLCIDSHDFNSQRNRNNIRVSAKKLSNLYKDLTYTFLNDHESMHNISNVNLEIILAS
jgi:two-component system OmpR family sensor kinase